MPLPSISEHGYLPAGVHSCTFEEAQARFGHGFIRRYRWWQLMKFVDHIRGVGIFKSVIIDGRFVSSEENIDDIDVALQLEKLEPSEQWLKLLRKYSDEQVRQELYEDYAVRMFVDAPSPNRKDYSEWFQNIKPEHVTDQGSPADARKGILLIQL